MRESSREMKLASRKRGRERIEGCNDKIRAGRDSREMKTDGQMREWGKELSDGRKRGR